MWEAIASNRRRSWVFIFLMGALLVALGFAMGLAIDPGRGGMVGSFAAFVIWAVLWTVAVTGGDGVILLQSKGRPVSRAEAPQLLNIVEEMKIASGLERMPEVYVIDDPSPNAFAVGRKPEKRCAVAVTSGLLKVLDRDELQGVIGHEVGHLKNRDTAFMVMAGVMLGAIVLMADLFLRMTRSLGRSRSRSSKGGGGQIVILLIAVLFALLAPVLARMLYMACSRRREYLADASAALFTRYPEGLASALQKIAGRQYTGAEVNKVLAPMYIINPMYAVAVSGLFSTHPPTEKRVMILKSMGSGADYASYEESFRKIMGGTKSCIGKRSLAANQRVEVRPPSAEAKEQRSARTHDVIEMMGRLNNLILLSCACGVQVRVPGTYRRDSVTCPRCNAVNRVPAAQAPAAAPEALRYRRTGRSWESFKCPCGGAIQLGPTFSAPTASCPKCRRKVEISS